MKSFIRNVACTVGALLLGGCAAGGAAFDKPQPAPENGAMAYFYRPPEVQGSARTLHITDHGQEITALSNGQFSSVPLDVGHHELRTSASNTQVTLDAVAGETYYLRFAIEHGVVKNTMVFARVYPEDAVPELQACCKDGSESTPAKP